MSIERELVTLVIDGVEDDFLVKANVIVEPSASRGTRSEIDGPVEVWTGGKWTCLDELNVTAKYRELAEDALCDVAMEDDSDECAQEDKGDLDREERWAS